LRKSEWSAEELEQLAAIVAAGGTAFRPAAKFKRSIISCRNQACKMGKPFTPVRTTRKNILAKCVVAERELAR
jgi:hypothetical protein